ncbi:MAG TPA: TPM domain-containing protein [Verrucomicrobiae bacterium]|nr:TPM domain-containing protein [Verrucomicrobiae bacterium]
MRTKVTLVKSGLICVTLGLLAAFPATGAEVIPPKPDQYFNDYANVTSPGTTAELDRELEDFERKTSSQILVVIYPKMQSDSSIEDYTVRVAQSWRVGQKGKDNGAVLFVFVQDRKIYLQVGYGLEGALPDALAKRIIENEIKPYFRRSDFDGGLKAGVAAILQATQGEYKGTGHTAAEGSRRNQSPSPAIIAFIIALVILFLLGRLLTYSATGTVYGRGGRAVRYGVGPVFWGGFGGGGFGGGGGGGFSGGGFSGGGGSFGGGGAGGSW